MSSIKDKDVVLDPDARVEISRKGNDRFMTVRKLSDLLELALADLAQVEGSSHERPVQVDMGYWHATFEGVCFVCLAGAVMDQTLKIDPEISLYGLWFDEARAEKFLILDAFARGDFYRAHSLAKKASMDVPGDWKYFRKYFERVGIDYHLRRQEWFDVLIDTIGYLRHLGM